MMTNFERLIVDLTVDKFIDMVLLNCDGCPAHDECRYCGEIVDGFECSDTLEEWCNRIYE